MSAYGAFRKALERILKPTRSTAVKELDSQTIAPSDKAEFTVDDSDTDGYSAIVLTVRATYSAAATSGVRVRWLYSPDGTVYDSEEDAEDAGNYEDLTFAAGETRQRPIVVPIFKPYIKVQVVNLDTAESVTVSVWRTLIR